MLRQSGVLREDLKISWLPIGLGVAVFDLASKPISDHPMNRSPDHPILHPPFFVSKNLHGTYIYE